MMNVPANSFDCLGESLVFLLVAGWWMFSVIPKEGQQVLKEGKRESGERLVRCAPILSGRVRELSESLWLENSFSMRV